MYFVYSLLLTLGLIALLPRFLFDAIKHGKYIPGLRERLGKLPAIEYAGRPVVWLHCVSVGETEAARPLVRALIDQFPAHALVVSTTTLTGQTYARKIFDGQAAAVFYCPFDWAWTVRRALRALNPVVVLIMETELWPRLLHECRERKIPVALVNGRISEKSFRGYKLLGGFIRRVVKDLTIALMQSEADAERLRRLGLPNDRIQVAGNLKFESEKTTEGAELTRDLGDRFGFGPGSRLIVAASTHDPEEQVVLDAFKELRPRARLVIAPRHPERFEATASLLQRSGLTWARRSEPVHDNDKACEVILLDSIGELRAVFPLAALVFVGGSIATHGGHNMLEPAADGACVVVGAHTQNFAAIMKALVDDDALVQLPDATQAETTAELVKVFGALLDNDDRRREIAARASAVCERNRGATERTVQMFKSLLAQDNQPDRALDLSAHSAIASK